MRDRLAEFGEFVTGQGLRFQVRLCWYTCRNGASAFGRHRSVFAHSASINASNASWNSVYCEQASALEI